MTIKVPAEVIESYIEFLRHPYAASFEVCIMTPTEDVVSLSLPFIRVPQFISIEEYLKGL